MVILKATVVFWRRIWGWGHDWVRPSRTGGGHDGRILHGRSRRKVVPGEIDGGEKDVNASNGTPDELVRDGKRQSGSKGVYNQTWVVVSIFLF